MRVTIERDVLLAALGRVAGVVPTRGTIPILTHVALSADRGAMHLAATDLDVECSESAACDVAEKGATTVSAKLLGDLVRNLPTGGEVELTLKPEQHRLTVKCGRSKYNFPTLPAVDFPTMAADNMPDGGEISGSAVARIFDKVRFAVSTEETRYYLQGVCLHLAPPETDARPMLRAVATDGHRLAMLDTPMPDGFTWSQTILVPAKASDEIRKLVDGFADVELRVSGVKIEATAGETRLISKLLDGQFPDYSRVVPLNNPHRVTLDAKILSAAVKRATVVADDKSRSLKLTAEKGVARLTARSPENGDVVEELDADYDGPRVEIGLNGKYLVDIANRVGGDQLQLQIGSEAAAPILVVDPADKHLRFVLMPLRV